MTSQHIANFRGFGIVMVRLHRVLGKIWKKRWHLSLTILFLVVEYYTLTVIHKSNFSNDDFLSINLPPSTLSSMTSRNVAEAPAAIELPPTKGPTLLSLMQPSGTETPAFKAHDAGLIPAEFPGTESSGIAVPPVDSLATKSPVTETPAGKAHIVESPDMESPGTESSATKAHIVDPPIPKSPATEAPATKAHAVEFPAAESRFTVESLVAGVPAITAHDSPVSKVPVASPTKKNCFISSYSNDGIGHQMEAKISCLATALILNSREVTQGRWTYIHQPVNELQHGQDPSVMEELFGFSKILTEFYDPETMELSTRELLTWPPQPDDMIQVFNGLCPGNNEATEKAMVFNADNCWDFLYCRNHPLPDEWYTRVVPIIRTTILQGASYVQQGNGDSQQNDRFFPHKTNRMPGRCFIVMHIRLGDAEERKMSGDWIHAMWRNLLTAQELLNQQNSTPFLSYQLAIHSDGTRDTVLDMLKFSEETVIYMEDYDDATRVITDDKAKTIVSLYCRNEERATLMTTVYDMLTADIFITSDSSLSHAGSLLRNVTLDGPTIHPPNTGGEFREQLGTILGWYFLKKSETDTTMMLWSNHEWNAVVSSFWSNLFMVYFSHTTS
jgi:hypothetical protein